MIKGAIFDMDGLLFDTEAVFQRCWQQACRDFGIADCEEMRHAFIGCGRTRLPDIVRRYRPEIDAPAFAAHGLALAFAAQLSSVPELKPGVCEILAKCRANGIKTAVASSSSRKVVEHNLASTGLAGSFDAVVTGLEVSHGKPAPDIFLLAAERIGIAPADCLVFEDAFSGIRAAQAAGCRPVLVPDYIPPTAEILEVCTCRSSLLEALGLLGI